MTDQTLFTRVRLHSTKSHNDYYTTLHEKIHSADGLLLKLSGKMLKPSVLFLFQETISQHRAALKQNKRLGSSIGQLNVGLQNLTKQDENNQDNLTVIELSSTLTTKYMTSRSKS